MATQLDARKDRIRREIEEAVRLREEAQAMLATYQKKYDETIQEAEKIIEEAKRNAAQIIQDAQAEVASTIEKRRAAAVERIEQAEQSAVQEVKAKVVEASLAVATRILQDNMDEEMNDEVFQQTLGQVQRKVH
jgi:F-type H+-transporting ATPase subunit b